MHPEFGVHRGCRVQKMIMQERHINRKQYFEEQAATSRKYYLKETDYFVKLRSGIRVLEVGCGEGGNLLPYAKAGCLVTVFERLCAETSMLVAKRTLWFVNPHYEQKFGLHPRRLWKWVAALACARNYITTSAFYLLKSLPRGGNK